MKSRLRSAGTVDRTRRAKSARTKPNTTRAGQILNVVLANYYALVIRVPIILRLLAGDQIVTLPPNSLTPPDKSISNFSQYL